MTWLSVKQHPRSLRLVLKVLLLLAHAPPLTIKEWQPTSQEWPLDTAGPIGTMFALQQSTRNCYCSPIDAPKKVAQTWRRSRSIKLQVQHCVTVTHRVQTKPKGRQYPAGPAATGHTRHTSHKPPSVRHQTKTTSLYLATRSLRHTHALLLVQVQSVQGATNETSRSQHSTHTCTPPAL